VSDEGGLIGVSDHPEILRFDGANRHGLVAGATGTGKTVTLQVLAEGLSAAGAPVFAADVKGAGGAERGARDHRSVDARRGLPV
jgi:DNA helicase HerA-like ATPase